MTIPNLELTGKVALISGGSRGIGAAAVRMFTSAGARVVFNYEKAKDAAVRLAGECGAGHCQAIQATLDTVDSAQPLVEATVKHFGRLDILVGNHGIWPPEDMPVDQMTAEQWQRTMRVNLDSYFGLVKYSVAQMKKQAQPRPRLEDRKDPQEYFANGHIVLVSSTAGQRGEAGHCDYAATKGAVISMVKGLSTELAPFGIYVNCVAPGWVLTDMARETLADPVLGERVRRTIPLGRAAKPEEIAASILFLCTPHAGFVTGEIFNANGGAVLAG